MDSIKSRFLSGVSKQMDLEMEKLNEISSMQMYKVNKRQTVASVLKELGLESKFFAVLINGKRVDLNETLEEGDEILILPKIAGG